MAFTPNKPLVTVQGFRELQRLFAKAGPEARKEVRSLEREVADPVKVSAQAFAVSRIPRITQEWAGMRIGITRSLVYVAPRKRGTKVERRKRKKFARLLDTRSLTPAGEANQPLLEKRMDVLFSEFSSRWNGIR